MTGYHLGLRKNALLLSLAFLLSVAFTGCENAPTLGPLPVQATINQPFGEWSVGSHEFELSLPTPSDPYFRIKDPQANASSEDVLVIPQNSLSEESDYSVENRENIQVIQGEASNGIKIEGKLFSSVTIAVSDPGPSGHRTVSDALLFRFSAQLSKNGQPIGEIHGRKIVAR